MPGVEVVGTVPSRRIATWKIEHPPSDWAPLDIEIPEVDALKVFRWLQPAGGRTGAVMLGAFTGSGAKATVEA